MSSSLEQEHAGRVAMITGGGRGFGKAFGHALAERGAHVFLLDLDGEAAAAAAAEIRAVGGSAVAITCDVANEQQVDEAVSRIVADHGGIDVLINNAGLHSLAYSHKISELGIAKVRALFDVNIMGVVICSMLARPAMAGREGASIVNISSSSSYPPTRPYGVSKMAVRALTLALADDFGAVGIRVNGIAPGLIFTETVSRELTPELIEGVLKSQSIKRKGEERDVVEAMLYLISSRASFVTGDTLKVTGGSAPGF